MKLQDLKRGMRCTRRDGSMIIVDKVDVDAGNLLYYTNQQGKEFNTSLSDYMDNSVFNGSGDIMKIEDITVDGFEVIWERPKKYYLHLPHIYRQSLYGRRGYLNHHIPEHRYFFSDRDGGIEYKTQFTQEEIDNLPNQNFIKTLTKEEVK